MTIVINGTTGISGVDGSAGTPAVQGTDTNTGVFYPAADTVGVSTGGSERVRVDSSGNVGIGTTNTTDQRLKVKQSADTGASSFSFKVEANANDTGLYIGYRGAGAATAADTCAITATYGSTGAFKPMTFLTSDAERMRIDSSGNVGIGTSTNNVYDNVAAGRPLVVQSSSSATTAGSSTNAITISNSDTTTNNLSQLNFAAITGANASQFSAAWIACQYGARTNGQYPTGQLIFATSTTLNNAPSEKMRIDSSGNVGIGTTNPSRSKLVIGATTPQISFTDTDGTSNIVDITRVSGPSLSFSSNGTEVGRFDNAGLFKFNSGYGSVATAYGCRAWVNFNGTGTVAIRASGNVTSITDNNVGNYTVNFTNAMPDANYAVTFGVGGGGSGLNASFVAGVLTSTQYGTASNKTTTALQFTTGDYTATLRDLGEIYVSIFR